MALLSGWFKKGTGKEIKTALALGGGGIRGLAHLGVMKVLEKNPDHHYHFMVGTSAGAVFGSLYQLSRNADEAIDRVTRALDILNRKKSLIQITSRKSNFLANIKEKIYLAKSLFALSIIDATYQEEFLVTLLGENISFEQLKKPLYVVATDLVSGKDVVFSRGDLIPALMASSAIPGAFPPHKYRNYCLIDGGSTQKLPTKTARLLGAERILAVDVGSPFQEKIEFTSSPQIISRSEAITSSILHQQNRLVADLLLTPTFREMKWYDFHRYREALEAGQAEARKKYDQINRFFRSRPNRPRQDITLIQESLIMD